jgi:hypothetical protein
MYARIADDKQYSLWQERQHEHKGYVIYLLETKI